MKDELGNEVTDRRQGWLLQQVAGWAPDEHRMEAQLILHALVAYQVSTQGALDLAVSYILAAARQGDQGAELVLGLLTTLVPEVKERLAAIRPVPRQEEGDR